eukprot:3236376-Rhodomonas_salina.1
MHLVPPLVPGVVDQPPHQGLDALAQSDGQLARRPRHVQAVEAVQRQDVVAPVPPRCVAVLPAQAPAVLVLQLPAREHHHGQRRHGRAVAHVHLRNIPMMMSTTVYGDEHQQLDAYFGRLHALMERHVRTEPPGPVQLGVDGRGVHGRRVRLAACTVCGAHMQLDGGSARWALLRRGRVHVRELRVEPGAEEPRQEPRRHCSLRFLVGFRRGLERRGFVRPAVAVAVAVSVLALLALLLLLLFLLLLLRASLRFLFLVPGAGMLPQHQPHAIRAVELAPDVLRVVGLDAARDHAQVAQVLEQLPLGVTDLQCASCV